VGSGPCIGDSGGPALSSQGAVTGVYSQLGGSCDSATARQYFTQVAPFMAEVVMPAFSLAGYEPIPEATTTSDAGAGGDGAGGEAGAASSVGGGENGDAGPPEDANPPPPGKGGCRCSTTATPRAGAIDRLATALLLGFASSIVSRRRGRRRAA
jgi:hypothetical protein